MIKLYICCLVLIIGSVEVGPDIDMKFHQEVMEIVSYDICLYIILRIFTDSFIVKHTVFYDDILSLYNSCMTFVYYFMPSVGHLHNPYCISLDILTRGHPSSRYRFSNGLTENFQNSAIVPMILKCLV